MTSERRAEPAQPPADLTVAPEAGCGRPRAAAAGSGPVPASRRLLAGALAAAALTAVLHGPRLSRPLERSVASANTTYMVMFARNWDRVGFGALRGVPTVGTAGDTAAQRGPYLHHPPLSYWLMYAARRLLGWNEAAFRLVPFLALVAAAGLTVLLAGRLAAPWPAVAAGALLPATGMAFGFGLMPGTESLVLLVLVGGSLCWLRQLEAPRRRRRLLLWGILVAGCLVDWQAAFLVPALLVAALLMRDRGAGLREAALLVPVAAGAYVVFLAWGAWALGAGPVAVLAELWHTALAAAGVQGPAGDGTSFLANQLKTWRQYLGWPLMAVAAGMVLWGLLRPRGLRGRSGALLAGLALPVVLSMGIFREPAWDHDFYWMPVLAVLPAAFAVAVTGLWRRKPAIAALVVAVVFTWSGALDLLHEQETASPYYRDLGRLINKVATEDDLVFAPEGDGPAMFYTSARLWELGDDPQVLQRALDMRERGEAAFDRLIVYLHTWSLEGRPELLAWLDARGERRDFPSAVMWEVRG